MRNQSTSAARHNALMLGALAAAMAAGCAHAPAAGAEQACVTVAELTAQEPSFAALTRVFRDGKTLVLRAPIQFDCGRTSECRAPRDRWVELSLTSRESLSACSHQIAGLMQLEGVGFSHAQLAGGVYGWGVQAHLRSESGAIDVPMYDATLALLGDGSALLLVRESAPKLLEPAEPSTSHELTLTLYVREGSLEGELWLRRSRIVWPMPGEWVSRATTVYRAQIGRAPFTHSGQVP